MIFLQGLNLKVPAWPSTHPDFNHPTSLLQCPVQSKTHVPSTAWWASQWAPKSTTRYNTSLNMIFTFAGKKHKANTIQKLLRPFAYALSKFVDLQILSYNQKSDGTDSTSCGWLTFHVPGNMNKSSTPSEFGSDRVINFSHCLQASIKSGKRTTYLPSYYHPRNGRFKRHIQLLSYHFTKSGDSTSPARLVD